MLVKLSRLTERHTLDELRDRNTAAHMEMIDLITKMTMRKTQGSAVIAENADNTKPKIRS